jgi:hypothetical protein
MAVGVVTSSLTTSASLAVTGAGGRSELRDTSCRLRPIGVHETATWTAKHPGELSDSCCDADGRVHRRRLSGRLVHLLLDRMTSSPCGRYAIPPAHGAGGHLVAHASVGSSRATELNDQLTGPSPNPSSDQRCPPGRGNNERRRREPLRLGNQRIHQIIADRVVTASGPRTHRPERLLALRASATPGPEAHGRPRGVRPRSLHPWLLFASLHQGDRLRIRACSLLPPAAINGQGRQRLLR